MNEKKKYNVDELLNEELTEEEQLLYCYQVYLEEKNSSIRTKILKNMKKIVLKEENHEKRI